jgi:ubiquinone biosynthesis monooxygenase Coq7
MTRRRPPILPGDPGARAPVERIIRVDHAGEYGAVRIYAGQLAVLGRRGGSEAVRHMAEQERRHLATFEKLMIERRVRPTALAPLWHVAGFALGAGSALLGEKGAMAATAAVEDVIHDHYARQAAALGEDEAALREVIEEARADEIEHRNTALEHGAAEAPAQALIGGLIRRGTRLAIWLSERV